MPQALGKQVIYVTRTRKGFSVRVSEHGRMSYVLTHGANRERIKLGEVGVVKLAETRQQARAIMRRAPGRHPPGHRTETYERALAAFLEAAKANNRDRTVRDYTRCCFGSERLGDITVRDIHRKLDRLSDTPSEQTRALRDPDRSTIAHAVGRETKLHRTPSSMAVSVTPGIYTTLTDATSSAGVSATRSCPRCVKP